MNVLGSLPVPPDLAHRLPEESYAALLGYPEGILPDGRAEALARASRQWCEEHAAPWAYAAGVAIERTTPDRVDLASGPSLSSARLAGRLAEIGADRLIVAVVTAGAEVDAAAAEHWREERPDEGYFLDRFGAALAIRLGAWAAEHLRAVAQGAGLDLGPGYSPGYDGWDLADQVRVARLLPDPPGALEVLESGMIDPKNSLLAVFGATDRPRAAERQWQRHRCSWCSLSGCGLRGRPSLSTRPGRTIHT